MTKQLQTINAPGGAVAYGREQVELLKRTIAKGASDDDLKLFLHVAERTGLDPFARQIHCVRRWNADIGTYVMTSQTGIDGYRLIAERTGNYCPGPEPTFEYDKDGKLVSATATVKKRIEGSRETVVEPNGVRREIVHHTWEPVTATARYDEYVQTAFLKDEKGQKIKQPDGSWAKRPTEMWATKGHIMIGKCAEALALRKAFPAELSGLYTDVELPDTGPVAADTTGAEPERPAPTGDKPKGSDRVVNNDEIAHLTKKMGEFGFTAKNVQAFCHAKFGKDTSKALTVAELAEVVKWMEDSATPPSMRDDAPQEAK